MSRIAPLFSFALHAAVLFTLGKRSSSTPPHAGPGEPGTAVTFSAVATGLLVELAPAPAAEAAPALLPAAPEFTPPAPAINPPPSVELLTAKASPIPAPAAATAKATTARSERTTPRGSRAPGATPGTAGGSGLARGGAGYMPPRFHLRYKPAYPEEARARRLEGTVLLLVSLDASGRVTEAAIRRTCGHGSLDRAALRAVRSWRFDPARQNGTAIAAQVEIPIRFRFEAHVTTRA